MSRGRLCRVGSPWCLGVLWGSCPLVPSPLPPPLPCRLQTAQLCGLPGTKFILSCGRSGGHTASQGHGVPALQNASWAPSMPCCQVQRPADCARKGWTAPDSTPRLCQARLCQDCFVAQTQLPWCLNGCAWSVPITEARQPHFACPSYRRAGCKAGPAHLVLPSHMEPQGSCWASRTIAPPITM